MIFYLERSRLQAEQELEDGGQGRFDETSEHRAARIGNHCLKIRMCQVKKN